MENLMKWSDSKSVYERLLSADGSKNWGPPLSSDYPFHEPMHVFPSLNSERCKDYSSLLELFEEKGYKGSTEVYVPPPGKIKDDYSDDDYPDPNNLSDYDDNLVVVPEDTDPVYYKKARRYIVAADRYLENMRLKHGQVGDEDKPSVRANQEMALPGTGSETPKSNEKYRMESMPGVSNRMTLVTRNILEVVLPEYAIPKLITRSKNKLAQISDLSGANVKLLEDGSETTEKIIQISGTPEQAERAQSLLQGFILSTQGDA